MTSKTKPTQRNHTLLQVYDALRQVGATATLGKANEARVRRSGRSMTRQHLRFHLASLVALALATDDGRQPSLIGNPQTFSPRAFSHFNPKGIQ